MTIVQRKIVRFRIKAANCAFAFRRADEKLSFRVGAVFVFVTEAPKGFKQFDEPELGFGRPTFAGIVQFSAEVLPELGFLCEAPMPGPEASEKGAPPKRGLL